MSHSSGKPSRKAGAKETAAETSGDSHSRIDFQANALGSLVPSSVTANRGPKALNDTNGSDGVKEAGLAPGGTTALAGDRTASGNVLANDKDRDGDILMVVSAGGRNSQGVGEPIQGKYGSLILNSDGTWTYTLANDAPSTNALRQGEQVFDTFIYTVSDGNGGTDTATLRIKISGTNDAPIAEPDIAFVEEGASVSGDLALNDRDPDRGDRDVQGNDGLQGVLTYTLNSPVAGLNLSAEGTYTFDASDAAYRHLATGETMEVVASYTVTDEHGASATSTLTITVTGPRDSPTLAAEAFSLEDTEMYDAFSPITGQLDATDGNSQVQGLTYSIVDGDPGTVEGDTVLAGLYGTLTVHPDGSYIYLPDVVAVNALQARVDEFGAVHPYQDAFHVQVTNGSQSATSTLTVNISGANDAPTIEAQTIEKSVALGDGTLAVVEGQLSGSDVDLPGQDTTYAVLGGETGIVPQDTVRAGQYGTLTVHSDGSYSYAPDAAIIAERFPGGGEYEDLFDVQITDDALSASALLTFRITVASDPAALVEDSTEPFADTTSAMNITGASDSPTSVSEVIATLGAALAGANGDASDPHNSKPEEFGPLITQMAGELGALVSEAARGNGDTNLDLSDLLVILDDTPSNSAVQDALQLANGSSPKPQIDCDVAFGAAPSSGHADAILILFDDPLPPGQMS